jgi:hypothetical protein
MHDCHGFYISVLHFRSVLTDGVDHDGDGDIEVGGDSGDDEGALAMLQVARKELVDQVQLY